MKSNELRIGNKVNLYGSQATIIPNDFEKWFQNSPNWEHNAFKGIPLTEEWLLKFGFDLVVKEGNQGEFRVYQLNEITYNTNNGWWWKHHLTVQPKYIHELQNLFFAITGKELTI